jgi:predicted transcriptional regulator
MNGKMMTICVGSLDDARARLNAAFRGKASGTARYVFSSRESLLRTLTTNRWGIVEALTGAGPLGVRELARRVGRDVKGVHTDAQALVVAGLIDKTSNGKLWFPYDAVRVEFEMKAAA